MTVMISHHISDTLLLGYAAGSLSDAFDLAVATHVSFCDECRTKVMVYEELGGSLLMCQTAETVSDSSLAACLERLDKAKNVAQPSRRHMKDSVLPGPLVERLDGGMHSVPWRSIGLGVRQALLKTADKQSSARLLSIPAGASMPHHGHRGTEITVVLQGAFHSGVKTFARGDAEMADDDVQHQPIAAHGEVCICLAVTEAPLRMKGFIPRLVQPFIGI